MPHLPPQLPTRDKSTLFWPTGTFQTYEIPDNSSMLHILCVGGGGGGGNGFSAAAVSARGGGGGGGCGGFSRMSIPVISLPRVLYVQPGLGGQPVTAGGASAVTRFNVIGNLQTILQASGGGAGGNGTGAAAGAAGAAGAIATILTCAGGWTGNPVFNVGAVGGAGGVHTGAVGVTVTYGVTTPGRSGGAGGAGVTAADFAGGGITGALDVPTLAGAAAGSNAGQAGYWNPEFLHGTGGCGGGSSNAGVGGAGGNGAPGSGGGGGGGPAAGGGDGGDRRAQQDGACDVPAAVHAGSRAPAADRVGQSDFLSGWV